MKVEDRIEEAIYQLEKIKEDIIDYDSCREEAISGTDALEKIRTILHENKEYMYAGQPIVDKVIEEINKIIGDVIGTPDYPTENQKLDIATKIYQIIMIKRDKYIKQFNIKYSSDLRFRLSRFIWEKNQTNWDGLLNDGFQRVCNIMDVRDELIVKLLVDWVGYSMELEIPPIPLTLEVDNETK